MQQHAVASCTYHAYMPIYSCVCPRDAQSIAVHCIARLNNVIYRCNMRCLKPLTCIAGIAAQSIIATILVLQKRRYVKTKSS